MIGVLGVGGAGGNIADEAHKNGILSAAINFSQKDLDSIDVKYKLRLSGSEGVGKNRDEGLALFKDQWEIASRFVQERFSNVDAIVVAFSSSGGSGSAVSPLLIEILRNLMPDMVIVAFVVVPELSEVTVSQANFLSTFEELSRLDIAIFPIDNQQVKASHIGKNKIFEITNKKAVDLIKKIADYTEKHSKNGNFDKKDFLTVLGTKGIGVMTEVQLCDIGQNIELSTDWVASKFNESLVSSIFVPVEFEKVTRAAVIFDGQESLMEFIDHDSMFSKFKNGLPLSLFEGNYNESNGKLLCILVGLSWCNKRLHDVEISLENNKENVESVLTVNAAYKSNTSDLFNKLRNQPEKKQSVMDILKKYQR